LAIEAPSITPLSCFIPPCPYNMPMARKKTDSQKLDQIITMLADVVDVFGKRFDAVDDRIDGAIVKIDGVQNTLDARALVRADQRLPARVESIEKHLGINKKIAA
jgi:hypothetical protein